MLFGLHVNDWITIISLLVAVEMAIGHGTVSLTNAVPEKWVPSVQAWCNILAFIGSTMVTALSRMAGVLLAGVFVAAMLLAPPAHAQARKESNKIGGPVGHALDTIGVKPLPGVGQGSNEASEGTVNVGGQKFSLTDDLIAKVLPDLKYATALAHQNNNVITAPCFDAILVMVSGWNAPVYEYVPPGAATTTAPPATGGTTTPPTPAAAPVPLTMPDPHVLVTLERASELLHQLQPDSKISVGCGALGQSLQKDLATLVGTVLSGGALGLFKLPIALP